MGSVGPVPDVPDVDVAVVEFVVARLDEPDAPQVRVVVDGVDLVELVGAYERARGLHPAGGYGGLVPAFSRFGPMTDHFLGGAEEGGRRPDKVPVLGCACGEWGCWPLLARIEADEDRVRWSAFAQPHRPAWDYAGFGPLAFRRAQYAAALASLERRLREPA